MIQICCLGTHSGSFPFFQTCNIDLLFKGCLPCMPFLNLMNKNMGIIVSFVLMAQEGWLQHRGGETGKWLFTFKHNFQNKSSGKCFGDISTNAL